MIFLREFLKCLSYIFYFLLNSKFIHCVDGQAFPTACAPSLVFNPKSGICDWAENVPSSSCTTESILGFTCPSINELLVATNQDVSYAKHMREFNLHVQSRHPHPTDCAKFYVCVYGVSKRVPRELSCEYGLVYNSESGIAIFFKLIQFLN